jgi:hypothetical protein
MLSTSLEAATIKMMGPDSVAREPEVFGNDFVEHFGGTRQHEVKLWNEAVTNWECECCFPVFVVRIIRLKIRYLATMSFFLFSGLAVERYLELA